MATLTETWEPANHLEQQLRDALRAADQDAYFAALSVAELFIPVPQAEPGAQPAFTWPTATRDGRTHVLAYTSPEAARICLGPGYEQFVRMSLTEIARSWPNIEWWLAVDSGLPIEGYLPAWFIGKLTSDGAQQADSSQGGEGAAPLEASAQADPRHAASPAAPYPQDGRPFGDAAHAQDGQPFQDVPPTNEGQPFGDTPRGQDGQPFRDAPHGQEGQPFRDGAPPAHGHVPTHEGLPASPGGPGGFPPQGDAASSFPGRQTPFPPQGEPPAPHGEGTSFRTPENAPFPAHDQNTSIPPGDPRGFPPHGEVSSFPNDTGPFRQNANPPFPPGENPPVPPGEPHPFPPHGEGRAPHGDAGPYASPSESGPYPSQGEAGPYSPQGGAGPFSPQDDAGPYPSQGEPGPYPSQAGAAPYPAQGEPGPYRAQGETHPPYGERSADVRGETSAFLSGDAGPFPPQGQASPFPPQGGTPPHGDEPSVPPGGIPPLPLGETPGSYGDGTAAPEERPARRRGRRHRAPQHDAGLASPGEAPPFPQGETPPQGDASPIPPHGDASPLPPGGVPPVPSQGEPRVSGESPVHGESRVSSGEASGPYGEAPPAMPDGMPNDPAAPHRSGLLNGAVPPAPAEGGPAVAETRPQPAVSEFDAVPPATPPHDAAPAASVEHGRPGPIPAEHGAPGPVPARHRSPGTVPAGHHGPGSAPAGERGIGPAPGEQGGPGAAPWPYDATPAGAIAPPDASGTAAPPAPAPGERSDAPQGGPSAPEAGTPHGEPPAREAEAPYAARSAPGENMPGQGTSGQDASGQGTPAAEPSLPWAAGPEPGLPITLHFQPGTEFTPLDDEERALYDAAQRGDGARFLRILAGAQQIWVPMVEGTDLKLGPGRPGFRWYTREEDGRTVVPLFTGPSRMREAMGGHPFVLSDPAKVLRFWPDPSWDLVVNVGSPIGGTIPGDRITELSRYVDAENAARLARDFPAQNDAEGRLFESRADADLMVKVLLEASVFLPVWSRTPPTVQTTPGDPEFPWAAVPVRGRMAVPVFTSFDWMKEAVGTTAFVMPAFAELLAAWPEPDWSVSVNPGTPIEVTLSGEQIRALGGTIADRVPGTITPPASVIAPPAEPMPAEPSSTDDARPGAGASPDGMPGVGEAAPGAPVEAPAAPPAEAPAGSGEEVRQAQTVQPAQVAGAAEAARAASEPAPGTGESADGAARIWTIMQKVVPHEQVPWYREKAYDRVAGFVHRVRDVIELTTPKQLYEALGLIRHGSPFHPDDAEVHVIRWPAYLPALYRVPFGGNGEDALATWGEEGWVIEAPPFQGDGFAPGSGGSIPEYKVDSLRLPHGAEMYVIGSDGTERFIARYDADRLTWGETK